MIVIINSDIRYTITKVKEDYFVKNNTLFPLEVTLKRTNCNTTLETLKTITLESNVETNIELFHITGDIGVFVENESTYNTLIKMYNQYIRVIVNLVDKLLCDCGCDDCDDCDKECIKAKQFLQLFSLFSAYFVINNPYYDVYFKVVSKHLKCGIGVDLIKQIDSIILKGSVKNEFYLKRLIAYYYLVLYIKESFQSHTKEEAEYIRDKYNYTKLVLCIKKLGINPEEVVEDVLSGMKVQYWQFTDTVSNINTVINNWNPTYIDSLFGVQEKVLEDFEQGVVVSYTNIGRIGFAVSPTQLINFSIVDSLGNDVTDDFDNHYFADEETVVFISKVPYSYSNIYFKFKKNVYI